MKEIRNKREMKSVRSVRRSRRRNSGNISKRGEDKFIAKESVS
jgi:hypothetical protein